MDAQMVRRGKSLPKLVNPAGPAQILDGFQALDGAGKVLTGSLPSFRFSNAKAISLSKGTVVSVAQYPLVVLDSRQEYTTFVFPDFARVATIHTSYSGSASVSGIYGEISSGYAVYNQAAKQVSAPNYNTLIWVFW